MLSIELIAAVAVISSHIYKVKMSVLYFLKVKEKEILTNYKNDVPETIYDQTAWGLIWRVMCYVKSTDASKTLRSSFLLQPSFLSYLCCLCLQRTHCHFTGQKQHFTHTVVPLLELTGLRECVSVCVCLPVCVLHCIEMQQKSSSTKIHVSQNMH